MRYARIGAGCYVVWGLLHIDAAVQQFALATTLPPGLVHGKINQGAWDLLFFAAVAILVAILHNWHNSEIGYAMNLIVVSAADLGFVTFVLIPGDVAIFPGILGPVFWLAGLFLTTLGIRNRT
jgi:hypothetical protein